MQQPTARQAWMAILAKSSVADLEQQFETLERLPEYTFLRQPEVGLTMIRGRAGGTGDAFNLGEMTVTRCVIKIDDKQGYGIIARLAAELDFKIYKNLGFYRLNDEIVTGVNNILKPYRLDFIPQIHCFLEYESFRVDLTEGNCNGKNKTIEDYDFIIRVKPDLTYQEYENYYLEYLQKYYAIAPQLEELGAEKVLEILETCEQQLKYQCSIMYQTI